MFDIQTYLTIYFFIFSFWRPLRILSGVLAGRPLTGQRPLGFGSAGAFMFVSDMSHPPPHAGHIQGCFLQIGVELAGYGNPKDVTDPTVVVIAVSSKL